MKNLREVNDDIILKAVWANPTYSINYVNT